MTKIGCKTMRRGRVSARSTACSVVATVLGLLFAPPIAAQVTAFGPLTFEEGGPLQRISYTPMTERAVTLAPGVFSTEVWLGFSNIFEQDSADTHELLMDMERLLSTTTVRYGVIEGLEIGGRLTFETTGGGVLDSFISWWHRKFSLGNANRERYASDEFDQRLEGAHDVVLLDAGQRTFALEDVRLFAKWEAVASADRRSLLSLRAVTRIPTHQDRIGEERTDFSLLALGQMSFETWYLHGMVGASTARISPELEAVTRVAAGFLMVGAERALNESVAGVIQFSVATPVMKGFRDRELDSPPTNLVLGLTGRLGVAWRWDVSFQEDIPSDTPAVDFTLGMRLSRSW